MSAIDAIIATYGLLETQAGKCMQNACGPFCSRCRIPCCRPIYCKESLESPFLAQVRQRFAPGARWDALRGWLTPSGCCLTAGRPPVCYEFLCRRLLERFAPQDGARLEKLAMVLTRAGRKAAGRRHLVELTDLNRINADRLVKQLAQAQAELADLQAQWAHSPLSCLEAGGAAPLTPS